METLRPTYRLSIGVPGKSNAFEISRRLGLPENLIEDAKKLLSDQSIQFEDVIANAEYHRQVAERERKLAEESARETVRLRDEAESLRREMEERRESMLRKSREEARHILENARRESDAILSDLKRLRKQAAAGGADQEAAALRRRMEQDIDSLTEGLAVKVEAGGKPPETVKPGDRVRILTLDTEGTVLSAPDARGEVQLQAGIMKFKAHISQLRPVKEKQPAQQSSVRAKTGAMTRMVSMECDVRGQSLEEALQNVDQYLDEAVLAGMGEVSIIHGKGTGVLRTGIQQHLRRHPHVKSFRLGVFGEGESGVTVVTLKSGS